MDLRYVAAAFVDAVNGADCAALEWLTMPDHIAYLACGTPITGRAALLESMTNASGYSTDTRFTVDRFVLDSDFVILLGKTTSGTHTIPTVWTLKLDQGRVASWSIYSADPLPYAAARN